jgi:hypothetical protein
LIRHLPAQIINLLDAPAADHGCDTVERCSTHRDGGRGSAAAYFGNTSGKLVSPRCRRVGNMRFQLKKS